MYRTQLDAKTSGATITVFFNFGTQLVVGETLSDATTTAAVFSGTDATPSSVISGSTTISGSQVSQLLTAGTAGVVYLITCTANTSAGQVLITQAYLVVTA